MNINSIRGKKSRGVCQSHCQLSEIKWAEVKYLLQQDEGANFRSVYLCFKVTAAQNWDQTLSYGNRDSGCSENLPQITLVQSCTSPNRTCKQNMVACPMQRIAQEWYTKYMDIYAKK